MSKQKLFHLHIVTPNGTVFSDRVIYVNAPGQHGRFGVLVNHIPAIFLLESGNVNIQAIGRNRVYNISGGLASIQNGVMKILTRVAQEQKPTQVKVD